MRLATARRRSGRPKHTTAKGQAVKKHFTAAAAAAATLLAAGCASTHHPAGSSLPFPSPAGASQASTVASAAINPACQAQLSAWQPAGERFEHMLLHDAAAAASDLQSIVAQAQQGAQPSVSAALTDSETLARTAKQMLHHHLPPSCVPHMRTELTAAMLDFEKQAADVGTADLALNDWNAHGAEQLLKAASHDITAGATGINQATATSNSYQR
jgi:hypothetical protein